jgi:hypothetical protein
MHKYAMFIEPAFYKALRLSTDNSPTNAPIADGGESDHKAPMEHIKNTPQKGKSGNPWRTTAPGFPGV